jgi:hypothetical protein
MRPFIPNQALYQAGATAREFRRALTSTVDSFINAQWKRYRLAVHPLVHRENCGDL